ncbi:hypothetical protein BD410DRAFT_251162 [Rickenella mellea]|uniref:DUF6534 domain-containing protein n=1 Tax=Rickenella mellea TaxID=50990 RepID=A0A4Y7QNQ7_9AGAM|nr:hypothetical protein BD410DRAFT_251162 [Rickenella mellea]
MAPLNLYLTYRSQVAIGMALGSSLACGIMISGSLCYFLNRSRTDFKRADSLSDSLIIYSLCTGLLASVAASVNLICVRTRIVLLHGSTSFSQ